MKYTLTPSELFPGTYDITVYVNEMPEVDMVPIHHENGQTFWYGDNNDRGFVRFGISHDDRDEFGHEPGYMWSSRASVFNGMFPVQCFCKEVDIAFGTHKYWGFAMEVEALIPTLSQDYELGCYVNDGEISVVICDVYQCPDEIDGLGKLVDTFLCGR